MRRPRIVVLRALKLGDFLTGVPSLRGLRTTFPEHEIVLLAPRWLRELAGYVGAVDRLVHHPGLVSLPADLFESDLAVDLHGCGPESQQILLESRPSRLISFAHKDVPETFANPAWRFEEHEVFRWCRLLQECGVSADPMDITLTPPTTTRKILPGTLLVHPGAASAARRWPLERFAQVVRDQRANGFPVIVTGGPNEKDLVLELLRRAGLAESCGIVDAGLVELAAIVSRVRGVLCGDTGIAHLSFALGTPSVVLYGPTPPQYWGPPPNDGRHRALWAGTCGDPHGRFLDPALQKISVEEVLDALGELVRLSNIRDERTELTAAASLGAIGGSQKVGNSCG